jgi:hypothetical protein
VTLFIGFAPWPVVLIWAYVDVPCKEEYDTPLGVDGERLDKFYEQGKGLAVAATFRASVRRNPDVHETPPRQSRSEKPKQNKPKVIVRPHCSLRPAPTRPRVRLPSASSPAPVT